MPELSSLRQDGIENVLKHKSNWSLYALQVCYDNLATPLGGNLKKGSRRNIGKYIMGKNNVKKWIQRPKV